MRSPTWPMRSAFKKSRPCVLVAPMTSKRRAAPYRIAVTHGGKKGLILPDQIRAVDKVRLAQPLGVLNGKTLAATLATLQEVFAP